MASPDHWQAMQITDAAVFYSRLTKWDEQFDQLPVHSISAQLYFKLSFEPNFVTGGLSNFVVDISDTLEKKMSSIRCYETQFPPEKQHVLDRVESNARHTGALAGYWAGEIFVCPRALGTPNLMTMLFPS